ncbi:Transposase InsO and inactivated derivatives [Micromonospora echinospora]|uniref:Transposase InsO and inactivated derivatives n=1 Tax=Micromonospora echinospora TaxID=1877 RepID=A0A1C4WJE9_MICEC|nr:IS481 family transposase [Micromonospora echinospora]SCE96011.1 Transposase InsO and inactivated derivatives [Micromonospora echinospora]
MEQRFHAVMECLGGTPKTEVAARYGVSRQTIHNWLARYAAEGVKGLEDRSHRPHVCPHRVDAATEALVCELRRDHPRWGPRRLRFEAGRRGVTPPPARATVYRILRRNNLVLAVPRKRRREDYRRWERPEPMELWQMDIVGGVLLADGTEAKVVTGLDDHSRYCVIATVVRRATGRAVCAAFAAALARFGVPGEVLTDNGKQFTGRFTKPRPGEVLFERMCRENGIVARNTKPRSPTTTGKVERFHQSLQGECLDGRVFATLEEAQAAVDAFVAEYNHDRPHQGIDDAFPADRFHRPTGELVRSAAEGLPLRLPAGLLPAVPPAQRTPPAVVVDAASVTVSTARPQPVQLVRVVPPSGNLTVAQQQVWLGPGLAGTPVTIWVDTDRLHVLTADGARIKSSPSRLSQRDLTRLLADGGIPAGLPPLPPAETQTTAVEVDRVVNACGGISISGRQISVGMPLAGQRVRVRLDGILLHVIDNAGQLRRTLRCPLPPTACARIRDARPASAIPPPAATPSAERVVSINGSIQVAGQRIQVGKVHARKVVSVVLDEHTVTVYDATSPINAVPRRSTTGLTRTKAHHHIRASDTHRAAPGIHPGVPDPTRPGTRRADH